MIHQIRKMIGKLLLSISYPLFTKNDKRELKVLAKKKASLHFVDVLL